LAEATAGRFRRVLLQREARLLKEYEGRICRDFDAVTAVSQQDARALREAAASPVEIGVVPITIDVGEVTVVQRRPDANRILYLGSLIWPPSLDGLLWFLRDVLPLIVAKRPDAEVDVVGANPPEEILASSKRDLRIRVHGYVADPTSILESAAVMVVPLRAGGGMRVRILNGLAHGVPIVSTTIGCEGIAVESGRDLLIADSPVAFADSVLQLLDDRELGASMSRAGRRLIEERYDSRAMGDAIESEYRRAIERRNRELR